MLPEKQLAELADDIAVNGLREAIKVWNGAVLDGRNRQAACVKAGVAPRFEQVEPGTNPFAYVWSLNGQRRDLTADQRYLLWKKCAEQSEAWQAEQKRLRDEANAKRAEAAKERPRNSDGTLSSGATRSGTTGEGEKKPEPTKKAKPQRETEKKAEASGTNRGSVERMDKLVKERPDLAEKVVTGELSGAAAIRTMKRDETVAKLEDVAAREVKAAEGIYDVIVIDPPWPMEKVERDERPNQVAFDYPTMSEDDLAALTVPAADDCHLWCWTTQRFLPMALRLVDRWGFRYVCTFVWHKPGGFQPIGLPQYNAEFAIYARKGKPSFIDTKAFPTCFDAPRGKHSEKPQEFYDMVNRVTAGRRLDMFNRRPINGFDGWGNESA